MPKARSGNFTLRRIVTAIAAAKAAHRLLALQRSGQYSELRLIARGKRSFDIVGYRWPDKGVRRRLGIGRARKNPLPPDSGLCAWCRHLFDRKTGRPTKALSPVEFEATRHDGTSHGICRTCKEKQLAGLAARRNVSVSDRTTANQVLFGSRGKTRVGWINRHIGANKYEIVYKVGRQLKRVVRDRAHVKFMVPRRVNRCPKNANPVAASVTDAARLSASFHGAAPRHLRQVQVTWPKSLTLLGRCAQLDYVSDKFDGKVRRYFHEFTKPCLVLAAPRRQVGGDSLILLKGRFTIGPEGISG